MHNIQGPAVPPYNPTPMGTDIFANVSGKWLLWTVLLFTLPATLSVFPGFPGILSLVILIAPVSTCIMGFFKSWKHRIPGHRKIYLLAFLLGIPITAGILMQFFAVMNTGDAEGATFPAWASMLAMLIVSIVGLSHAASLNPAIVARRDRFLANSILTFLAGTTLAGFMLPLLIVMGASLFVGGWLAFWVFMLIPLAIRITLAALLIRHSQKDKKAQGSKLPGKLIVLKPFFMWSGIVACGTFILLGYLLTSYILSNPSSF